MEDLSELVETKYNVAVFVIHLHFALTKLSMDRTLLNNG